MMKVGKTKIVIGTREMDEIQIITIINWYEIEYIWTRLSSGFKTADVCIRVDFITFKICDFKRPNIYKKSNTNQFDLDASVLCARQ